jgi:hypothetical protein
VTATARDVLAAFDSLPPMDKKQVALEILRRSAGSDELSDATLGELAADVFSGYDAEETTGADH